jgi:hypothetical protein
LVVNQEVAEMAVFEIVENGRWSEMKEVIKNYFDLLGDDDIERIGNSNERFMEYLVERYAVYQEEAQKMFEAFKMGLFAAIYESV